MKTKTILISGASIAGPTLAYWLHRYGFEVTVIERAETLRLGGQNIDVKGAAQKVAQMMGVEDNIRAANTGEIGIRFVDEQNKVKAEFPKDERGLGTSELEILRGDLAKLLYEHTKQNVSYIFGDYITALKDGEAGVTVSFNKGAERSFDLVIAADGIRSKTRELIFGNEPVVKFLKLYTAYLTVPKGADDTNFARWFNAPNSRVMFLRPDNEGTTRAAFSFISEPKGYEKLSMAEQEELLKKTFADVGWEAPRILKELDKSAELYFDGISQVIAPRWHKGRCAMVGDAAFCPSPLSGMGASLSMVGAYILAGELYKHNDYNKAFEAYEKRMRPYVEEIQNLPPGVPQLAHPSSKLGIGIFHTVLAIAASGFVTRVSKLFSSKAKQPTDDKIVLPVYDKEK